MIKIPQYFIAIIAGALMGFILSYKSTIDPDTILLAIMLALGILFLTKIAR